MNQVLQWIMAMVQKLQPKQQTSGSNTVQVEQAGGDVQIDNSHRPVTMVVTQNFYSAQVQARPAANGSATYEQREVLAVLRKLPDDAKVRVFDFMKRRYGTKRVIEVEGCDLRGLKRYMEVTLQNCEIERRKAS